QAVPCLVGRRRQFAVDAIQRLAEAAEPSLELLDLRGVAVKQKAKGLKKVGVVVVVLLVVEGQHSVGCCRQQKDADFMMPEELLSEFGRLVVALQEVLEPLEFIKDDQVRLKRVDARVRQSAAQLADHLEALAPLFAADGPCISASQAFLLETGEKDRVLFQLPTIPFRQREIMLRFRFRPAMPV